ncbi:hypothetical protein F511_37792 [Dorcoceras hygrometricum]|uniref:Uncharacterized protein n=1 Tax=Dorcoceras hygrometricum TaxID=472368 RepID=A0A2Z7B4C0_9LAMI|nr:hypothetical protein F511_37792 [Dorcoceras hygrometricum]
METSRVISAVRNQAVAKKPAGSVDTTAFCSYAKDSAGRLCVVISAVEATVDSVATQRYPDAIDEPDASNSSIHRLGSQAQRIEERAKCSSRDVKAAAKQLTIYERWMSTAELNSNGESDKKSAKRKGHKYCSLVGTLQRSVALKWKEDKIAIWSAEQFWKLSNGKKFYRGYIFEATPIEEVFEEVFNNELLQLKFVSAARNISKVFNKRAAADPFDPLKRTTKWYQSRPDLFLYRTGFSLDELSGCASLGQMPSFYFRCAVRSLGARLSDKHMGRDRRMKNLSCSLYWFFIFLTDAKF